MPRLLRLIFEMRRIADACKDALSDIHDPSARSVPARSPLDLDVTGVPASLRGRGACGGGAMQPFLLEYAASMDAIPRCFISSASLLRISG